MLPSGAEHLTFVFWGSRLITMAPLPDIVEVARRDPNPEAECAKLKPEKLWWAMMSAGQGFVCWAGRGGSMGRKQGERSRE
jgi:hypothetical protein